MERITFPCHILYMNKRCRILFKQYIHQVIEKHGLHGTEEMNPAIEQSDLELTLAILTGYIRQERFCDGLWESAVKDKTFLEILRRLERLISAA